MRLAGRGIEPTQLARSLGSVPDRPIRRGRYVVWMRSTRHRIFLERRRGWLAGGHGGLGRRAKDVPNLQEYLDKKRATVIDVSAEPQQ